MLCANVTSTELSNVSLFSVNRLNLLFDGYVSNVLTCCKYFVIGHCSQYAVIL